MCFAKNWKLDDVVDFATPAIGNWKSMLVLSSFQKEFFFQNTCRKNLRTFPSKLEWTVVLLFQGGIWPLLAWGLVDNNFVDDVGDDDVDVDIISDKGRFLISAISWPPFSHYFPTAATAILPPTRRMLTNAGKHSSTQLLQNLAYSPVYPPAYRRTKISSLRSCPIVFDSYTLAQCTTLEQILQHCNTSEIYSIVPSLWHRPILLSRLIRTNAHCEQLINQREYSRAAFAQYRQQCTLKSNSLHSSLTHHGDIILARYQGASPRKCSHASKNLLREMFSY